MAELIGKFVAKALAWLAAAAGLIALLAAIEDWARDETVPAGMAKPMPRYTVCTPAEMAPPPPGTVCLDGG